MSALYALDGMALVEPPDVVHALGDEDAGVRLHALQLADRWLDEHAAVLDRVLAMTDDADPRVRLQVAMTLGESQQPRAVAALARLAAVTVDLWKDFGEFTLTGIAPTALEGPALFDTIELLQSLEDRAAVRARAN
jgi:hypothetical protein